MRWLPHNRPAPDFVIADNYILNQTENERKAVMAPKVKGLINLDEAAKDVRLDFFILFSSPAAHLSLLHQD